MPFKKLKIINKIAYDKAFERINSIQNNKIQARNLLDLANG